MDAFEENLYAVAGDELINKNINRGIWAKAFSLCDGDEPKTKAKYIELRVESLREQIKEEYERRERQKRQERQKEEERLDEGKRVARLINPLKNLPYQETDHIPRARFEASPETLSHPIPVIKAAEFLDMFDFEIISFIKIGHLSGVYHRGEWFFDLDAIR